MSLALAWSAVVVVLVILALVAQSRRHREVLSELMHEDGRPRLLVEIETMRTAVEDFNASLQAALQDEPITPGEHGQADTPNGALNRLDEATTTNRAGTDTSGTGLGEGHPKGFAVGRRSGARLEQLRSAWESMGQASRPVQSVLGRIDRELKAYERGLHEPLKVHEGASKAPHYYVHVTNACQSVGSELTAPGPWNLARLGRHQHELLIHHAFTEALRGDPAEILAICSHGDASPVVKVWANELESLGAPVWDAVLAQPDTEEGQAGEKAPVSGRALPA